ncbi:MAG TPA: heme-binding domain-containing protein [Bacteroidota bacterium]
MKKILIRIILGLLGLFVVAQFIRPQLSNPQSDPALSIRNYKGIPPEVVARMEKSCFDCHSNETRWPWYSNITPVNFLLAKDVNNGRRHVNFSEWMSYKPGRVKSILDNIYDQVYNHEMPLSQYQLMHPDSKLTAADVKILCDWASGEEDRMDQESEMQSDQNTQPKAANDSSRKKK